MVIDMMRSALTYSLGLFYLVAGANHFINPDFYLPLIPDYLPFKDFLNSASGVIEIMLGVGVLYPATRRAASLGIIVLLVLFVPSHVHFIQIGGCVGEGLCVPQWVAWLRLVAIHPLLIYWAFAVSRTVRK